MIDTVIVISVLSLQLVFVGQKTLRQQELYDLT